MAAKARKVRQRKALKFLYVGRFLDGDFNSEPMIRQEFSKRHPLVLVLEGDLHFCKPHTRQCFRSPLQGFTGLRVVTQAEWPGLWLARPVGAGAMDISMRWL